MPSRANARHVCNKQLTKIFEIFTANNPNPTTELNFASPFECLVAVTLSAQATDVSVNKATDELYKVANTPEAIVALGEKGLAEYIKSIGLYNTKAKNVVALSKQLIEKHGSQVPSNREALEALPGVGRKTANVVLNTVFGEPVMAVDTHIYRVARRLGFSAGTNVLQVEKDLVNNIPDEYLLNAHHHLILHGRYICTAKKPKCEQCPIYKYCPYEEKSC